MTAEAKHRLSRELADIDSFQEFYRQHFVPVMRYCTSIVKDPDDASDVVQQAFIALWQRRRDLQIYGSAQAYLYKTVYHFSVNFLKQGAARKSRERKADCFKSRIELTDAASERELQRLIEEAVGRLPEGCRRIFRMSRNDGLPYRQIAGELKISEKTVENQMGKALRLLRTALQDYLPALLLLMLLYHE